MGSRHEAFHAGYRPNAGTALGDTTSGQPTADVSLPAQSLFFLAGGTSQR
jgi:hypothetical protein